MNAREMAIARKIPLAIIIPAVVAALLLGIFSYMRAASALAKDASNLLTAVQVSRADQVNTLLATLKKDIVITAGRSKTITATTELDASFDALGPSGSATLSQLYVSGNSRPAGERSSLDDAGDGSAYSRAHAIYNPILRDICKRNGYFDIFIISPAGGVIYSVEKEPDFAADLMGGPYKDSGLAKVMQAVLANPVKDFVAFDTYEAYAPSGGIPASFLATPILSEDKRLIGVFAIQTPSKLIADILQKKDGLGETGEAFLVGSDHRMHSDSRFAKESTILKQEVKTESALAGLEGKTGVLKTKDYRGTSVLSAHGPIEFLGAKWALMAEIDQAEVNKPAMSLLIQVLVGIILLGSIIAVVGNKLAKEITQPIQLITSTMNTLAEGRLDIDIPGTQRTNELGEMARAVEVFKKNGLEIKRMEAAQKERELQETAERQRVRLQLADDFEASMGQVVQAVSAAAEELQVTAQGMSALSEETNAQAAGVASAAEQSSTNLSTVAAATEELSGSIGEINRQVKLSSEIAERAVAQGHAADQNMDKLTQSVTRISEVVALIKSVADQTNLLALNATIEAARAGDAGKGFAVVADEVKTLAGQTNKATEDIRQQILAIQHDTEEAAVSIREIAKVIRENDEIVTSIAGAMEEQGATTHEIARNVEQAATGTREVSGNVQNLNAASEETGAASTQVLAAAEELSRNAARLAQEMQNFLSKVRAG